jgi:hypothetical protein
MELPYRPVAWDWIVADLSPISHRSNYVPIHIPKAKESACPKVRRVRFSQNLWRRVTESDG